MIISRYRNRPVTIPLPLQRYRYWQLATVTDRSPLLPNVTNRYWQFLTVTESYRYKRYKHYKHTLFFL